jgi:curved DNA-binding protein CbpA
MPDADAQEIRDAFRELARQYHPDRFHEKPDEVRHRALIHFRRVREAYERLLPE